MKNLARFGAGLALAAGALTATAPMASASGNWVAVHNSSSYSSQASCNANRSGSLAHIHRVITFKRVTYAGSCAYNRSIHRWTYGHITYVTSGGVAIKGDHYLSHP